MSGRWPDPVGEPLPPGLLSREQIKQALRHTVRWMDEPESDDFDPKMFGLLSAARAALVACDNALEMEEQALSGELELSEQFIRGRVSEAITARRVARMVINELRMWLPQERP